jgi:hypothetical protein
MEKEHGDERSPSELNKEFRKILDTLPQGSLSMLGTIMDSPTEKLDNFYDLFPKEGIDVFDPFDPWNEYFAEKARGRELINRRLISSYTYAILNKVAELSPKIQGTETFKVYYVPRSIKESLVFGANIDRTTHELYGDEAGGIFNPESVGEIEEKAFQRYWGDIQWYGVGLFGGMVKPIEIDYEGDSKQDMVGRAQVWMQQFIEKYGRPPKDVFGAEIIIS